jgi:glycosyltransferase involved in cell wall biosynthesis
MRILIVASDKNGHFAPFIEEQMAALQARGMEVLRYGITGKGIIGYLRELPALRRMIRKVRPDLIHAHYGLSGLLANLQRLVPVVTTYHGSDINVPAILRFSKIAMRLSAHNIFVSKVNVSLAYPKSFPVGKDFDTEEKLPSLQGRGGDRHFTLLPCGVNIPRPWSELQTQWVEQLTLNLWVQGKLDKEIKYVLFAGAFDNAVKDPELAKSVIAIYNSSFANRQSPIANRQSPIANRQSPIDNRQSPIANRQIELIELKGYTRDQVTALMYNCHALLMTSKTEGSPQVVKEAMACGCPIVSVDVGDVAERTSGVEGCYVVPTREPKDIAGALLKALAYNGRTNGRERIIAMGLSNEQVAKQLEGIYANVLAKRK